MPPLAPSRILQTSIARGMLRSVAPELIPQDGAYDLQNLLLDEDGAAYRRGGSEFLCDPVGAPLTFAWDGWLANGQTTVIATADDLYELGAGATVVPASNGVDQPSRVAVYDGVMYFPGGQTYDGSTVGTATETGRFYAVVASRLVVGDGDTVRFSAIGDPSTFDPTDYHRLPGGVQLLGIVGLRDAAVCFTTDGIYVIGNMAFNLTDDLGNVQQSLDRYSEDLVLWSDAGISGWSGSLVVPALDGVWLLSLGLQGEAAQSFQKISTAINDLYRGYVAQGCVPGLATVFRSHYILPILLGDDVVDTLVCRLDGVDADGPTFPWSRMAGFGGLCPAFATRLEGTQAQLLAITGEQAIREWWFQPDVASADADDSVYEVVWVTKDFATGPLNKNTVLKARLRYDMRPSGNNAAPVITAAVGLSKFVGTTWGEFDWGAADWTSPSASFQTLDGDAPVDVGAVAPFSWRVGKKVEFVRFLFRSVDESAVLSFRNLEVFVRDAGRL